MRLRGRNIETWQEFPDPQRQLGRTGSQSFIAICLSTILKFFCDATTSMKFFFASLLLLLENPRFLIRKSQAFPLFMVLATTDGVAPGVAAVAELEGRPRRSLGQPRL